MTKLIKCLISFLSGATASAVAHPEAVTTLAGAENAVIVGAVVTIFNSLVNYFRKGR